MILFSPMGAGVGPLLGAMSRTEHWKPTARPTVGVRPGGPNGTPLALGLQLQF
jgi:hypothetical protein